MNFCFSLIQELIKLNESVTINRSYNTNMIQMFMYFFGIDEVNVFGIRPIVKPIKSLIFKFFDELQEKNKTLTTIRFKPILHLR